MVLALCLSLVTYRLGLLTRSGCAGAFAIGFVIGAFGSVMWLALLILFALIGFAATLVGLSKKREKGLQEGENGERDYRNILGVAIPPLVFAVLNQLFENNTELFAIAYIATIAVAAADTAASELGVKDQKVWLITSFRRVEPGTDGGVSITGTAISFVASAAVSVIGYLVIFHSLSIVMIVPVLCGFLGCIADSFVGATVETWGKVSKYTNNCSTGLFGGLLAIGLHLLFF